MSEKKNACEAMVVKQRLEREIDLSNPQLSITVESPGQFLAHLSCETYLLRAW